MKKRILVSLALIPVIAFLVYAPYLFNLFFFLFLSLLSFLASGEIEALLGRVEPLRSEGNTRLWFLLPPLLLLAFGYTIPFLPGNTRGMLYVYTAFVPFVWLLSCAFYGLRRGTVTALLSAGNLVYCGVFPLLLLFLRRGVDGFAFICFLFVVAWINDAAAYFIGTYFGRIRGIVKYSPNKSLEGYLGAFVVSMVIANVFKLITGDFLVPTLAQTNLLGLGVSVMSPLGDLGESVFKRKTGVKDSSYLIPGMGGVLDVFDSILASSPVYFFLVKLIV